MKVFVSWSGERSRHVAQALHEWLPLVLHFAEPWVSHADIDAGERWAVEVARELEQSNFGIICLTQENMNSPWILFEAGALAKSLQQGRAIPLLLDIEFKDISGPLAQFQAKKIEKESVRELVNSINKLVEGQIAESRLSQIFDMAWPKLESKIKEIPKPIAVSKHNRPTQEVLEELVAGVRGLELRQRDSMDEVSIRTRRRHSYSPVVLEGLIFSAKSNPSMRYMIVGSALKDLAPWLYEIGAEYYRASREKDAKRCEEARKSFEYYFMMLRRGAHIEEMGTDKMTMSIIYEAERIIFSKTRPIRDEFIRSSGHDVSESDKNRNTEEK